MSDSAAKSDLLQCVVVTPEATVLQSAARFVALPLYDGEIGIAPRHSPMIGRLTYGEMRIEGDGQTHTYYVDGGFVQVTGDTVTVLTGRAVAAGSLDPNQATQELSDVQQRQAHGEERMAIRDRQLAQARAQLRVARRSGG